MRFCITREFFIEFRRDFDRIFLYRVCITRTLLLYYLLNYKYADLMKNLNIYGIIRLQRISLIIE